MKKKFICLLLAVAIMALSTQTYAYAATSQEVPCYIASLDCPEDYIEYAVENVSRFILPLSTELDIQQVSVGTPFAFADSEVDVFYFPILYNGHIQYLFRVYPSGDSFSGTISKFLANDIDNLAGFTSEENPMYLNRIGLKIIATIGSISYELYEYPDDATTNENITTPTFFDGFPVKNIKSTIDIDLNLNQTRNWYAFIDIIEQQKGNRRCASYCLAAIVRKLTNYKNETSYYIINYAYNYPAHISSNDYLPWNDATINGKNVKGIRSVAQHYGLNPTVLNRPAENSKLLNNIAQGRPCILRMMSASGGVDHAVVLCGCSTSGLWHIWNPWFDYYESFPANGSYVPTGYNAATHTLTHRMSAYNF